MIISVSAVVDTALRLLAITTGSGLLTLLLMLAFGTGATGTRNLVKWCAVFGTLAMIISWLIWGHPGVEFVA